MDDSYPLALKPGDFVQSTKHFGDIFFEVAHCTPPSEGSRYWSVTFYTYDKYGKNPRTDWVNGATGIRAVISAEMAVPLMMHKRLRFKASFGQYDPFYGFAPAGTPLRTREFA